MSLDLNRIYYVNHFKSANNNKYLFVFYNNSL